MRDFLFKLSIKLFKPGIVGVVVFNYEPTEGDTITVGRFVAEFKKPKETKQEPKTKVPDHLEEFKRKQGRQHRERIESGRF